MYLFGTYDKEQCRRQAHTARRDTARAMSQENVEIVRAVQQQFARGDFSWIRDVADFSSSLPVRTRMGAPSAERMRVDG